MNSKKYISSYTGHTNWVKCARFSPDGKQIASCSDDKTTKLFDVISHECIHTFTEMKGSGTCLAWHPNANLVAVGLTNSRVKVYDTRKMEMIQLYEVSSDAVTSVSFHPGDGDYLLIGSKAGESTIVDLTQGRNICTMRGHNGAVEAVAFDKDGSRMATGGVDRQVSLILFSSYLADFA